MSMPNVKILSIVAAFLVLLSGLTACVINDNQVPILVKPAEPVGLEVESSASGVHQLRLLVNVRKPYGNLSIRQDGRLLVDDFNLPTAGRYEVAMLLALSKAGKQQLTFSSLNAEVVIEQVQLDTAKGIKVPEFVDASESIGLDKVSSIKYGGPTVADIDWDGDYDFIVNNHNAESSKLYWNDGSGKTVKHEKNLARWFMHDLHGTAAGDYDQDGDLDLVVTMGGGNGTNPSKANFYKNNQGRLVLSTLDVGIDKGGRGRGARFADFDKDGDLDLLLFNEASLTRSKPQHFFYKNNGSGQFQYVDVKGPQDANPSRVLLTDLNNDQIDDLIFYGHHPLSVWLGNGDFTFNDATGQLPETVRERSDIMAMVDVDIDNDGDLDLYLARGNEFGVGANPSMDFDPQTGVMDIKPRGNKGSEVFSFETSGTVFLHNYKYLTQGLYRDRDYPVFLGKSMQPFVVNSGDELTIAPEQAAGIALNKDKDGLYFGAEAQENGRYLWQAALVRKGNIFWGYGFSLAGVDNVIPEFEPQNRNLADVLLINQQDQFIDGSAEFGLARGGNALGVTRGDFNSDGWQDLMVYRWGRIGKRISDVLYLNDGQGRLHWFSQHGATDVGGPGNGDMGQAFDFDLDGDLDLLSGSEGGEWYLYANKTQSNALTVRVGHSPKAYIDPYSATVSVKAGGLQQQLRVGSSGEVFSQSLLNILHFGLGQETKVEQVEIRWRNGETLVLTEMTANQLLDTEAYAPSKFGFIREEVEKPPTTQNAFVEIENKSELMAQPWTVGDVKTVKVRFNAGSAEELIAADQGGLKLWLRHFKYKWIPAKDFTQVNADVLYQTSGEAEFEVSLDDVTPTKELPEGHFYQLRVTMMSSDGETYEDDILPLKIVR